MLRAFVAVGEIERWIADQRQEAVPGGREMAPPPTAAERVDAGLPGSPGTTTGWRSRAVPFWRGSLRPHLKQAARRAPLPEDEGFEPPEPVVPRPRRRGCGAPTGRS